MILFLSILAFFCDKLIEGLYYKKLFLQDKFSAVDIRVRVDGGGHVSQIYAIRQAISKALVAYYQKCQYSSVFFNTFLMVLMLFQMLMRLQRRN